MKLFIYSAALLGLAATTTSAQSAQKSEVIDLTGAGSSFVYPAISKWAEAYQKKTKTQINYQSIGSGGGIKQIQANTVNFGATDKPLTPEELKKDQLVQFPIVSGGIVPVLNVPGIETGKLKLTGELLANIFLGKIKKWNDEALLKLNPTLKLPALDITVVHRSDGSGTTFIWANYLSKVSFEWKEKVGVDSAVNWPVGIGGKGNEGVAAYVQKTKGGIGYVEYAYALQSKMAYAQVKNKAGNFVSPSGDSFSEAAASAPWDKSPGFYLILTDAPGKKAWPIAGSTFILMRIEQKHPEQGKEALNFFKWVYQNGASLAKELHYVPIPASVVKLIEKEWKQIKI